MCLHQNAPYRSLRDSMSVSEGWSCFSNFPVKTSPFKGLWLKSHHGLLWFNSVWEMYSVICWCWIFDLWSSKPWILPFINSPWKEHKLFFLGISFSLLLFFFAWFAVANAKPLTMLKDYAQSGAKVASGRGLVGKQRYQHDLVVCHPQLYK